MTRNAWIQHQDPLVQWRASLESVQRTPDALFAVLASIVRVGQRHSVLLFERDPMQTLRDYLASMHTISFDLGMASPAADVCWYDRDDAVACGPVNDLGALLASLPDGHEKISRGFRAEGEPPVKVWGDVLRIDELEDPTKEVSVCIDLHSDIWMPFVQGNSHPRKLDDLFFDNRELASRHTPRLNAFVIDVASVLRDVGAELVVGTDQGHIPAYLPWVLPTGIRMDGPAPPLMPGEQLEWRSDEGQ